MMEDDTTEYQDGVRRQVMDELSLADPGDWDDMLYWVINRTIEIVAEDLY